MRLTFSFHESDRDRLLAARTFLRMCAADFVRYTIESFSQSGEKTLDIAPSIGQASNPTISIPTTTTSQGRIVRRLCKRHSCTAAEVTRSTVAWWMKKHARAVEKASRGLASAEAEFQKTK